MKKIKSICSLYGPLLFVSLLMNSCKPMQNLKESPAVYRGNDNFQNEIPGYDSSKKTVFIVADNKMTEIFDMLAPFYLFNTTGKANVYIIAKEKASILVKNGLFVLPQLTFNEADSLNIPADVIIIPALSKRDEYQDPLLIKWITNHFTADTRVLAVCDGASTAAATGLYDGIPLTCHASDYNGLKTHFSKPQWMQGVSVTKSGNLFSTAGVSNAVEGSLTIINELFGAEVLQRVSVNIHYPHAEIQTTHQSIALNGQAKFTIAKKIIFRKNKKIGLLLENGINEFEMASIIDTYARTLPASFKTYTLHDNFIQSKYGLILLCADDGDFSKPDELHLITPVLFSKEDSLLFKHTKLIRYDNLQTQYPIDVCLKEIGRQYGYKFQNVVKLLLDYN